MSIYTKNVPLGTLFLWEAGGICRCKYTNFPQNLQTFRSFFNDFEEKRTENAAIFAFL